MAYITGKKAIFFVTSPRSPEKMKEEIPVLIESVGGRAWNKETQVEFYKNLVKQDFFHGTLGGDIDLKARDRINRSPQALGFVSLGSKVQLTEAGNLYIYGNRSQEIFLKQLIKFQLPSPLHIDAEDTFNVRPYLELIRLIRDAQGLTKLEIAMFVMQLKHYQKYDSIKTELYNFRELKKSRNSSKESYATFITKYFNALLSRQFAEEIAANDIATRERDSETLKDFLDTKRGNHRDYADAAIRYLRATGLFSFDPQRNLISVNSEHEEEVKFICENIPREARPWKDKADYQGYLYSISSVKLLNDQREYLLSEIRRYDEEEFFSVQQASSEILKDTLVELQHKKTAEVNERETRQLKNNYDKYKEITELFDKISGREIVDSSLFFEWNTWRAFNMLNDGDIQGNFRIDEEGLPLASAPGNMPDILCSYDTFTVVVEVTLSSGNRQYEMEGEPVPRHVGQVKKAANQDTFCLFIAPTISPGALAHYYTLHHRDVSLYGGKALIIPISLEDFQIMLTNAYKSKQKPSASGIKQFCENASRLAQEVQNEEEWMEGVRGLTRSTFL